MTNNKLNSSELQTNVLIIGGGPAGIQAARLIQSQTPDIRVIVIRPEPHSMVYCALPYAMEGLFPLSKTFKSDQLILDVGAELIRDQASKVDFQTKTVETTKGQSIHYDKLFIATGAIPIRPNLPGMDLANVYTVKTAEDALTIMARLSGTADCEANGLPENTQDNMVAVVIGSGAIGIEQATAYRNRGAEVHLIEMRDHVLPNLLDADMSTALHQELEGMGIHLHMNTSLEALHGTTEVEIVELGDGSRLTLRPGRDMVVMAVGMRPDVAFLNKTEIEMMPDGIVVDKRMRTSVPNVWAAGDCTAGWSGIDGKPLGGKLATNAVPMAKIAAKDMLGQSVSYPGFFNGAATVVGQWRVAGTGFTEAFAAQRGLEVLTSHGQTTTRFPMMPGAGEVKVKLVVERKSGRVLGGQIVGSEAVAERIDVITLAIQQGLTAKDLAEFSYSSQPWQTFFPAKNAIVEAASAAQAGLP